MRAAPRLRATTQHHGSQMFQCFEDLGASAGAAEHIRLLRNELVRLGLDGFLVPRSDEHQGEYVAPASERLAWLTGFTGSAGHAVITTTAAALFVDGRYTLQARAQTPTKLFTYKNIPADNRMDWLKLSFAAREAVIGFDPWLHSVSEIRRATDELKGTSLKLKALARNPVDKVWGGSSPRTAQWCDCRPAQVFRRPASHGED